MDFVLVVPRSDLFAECYPQGFVPFAEGRSAKDFERLVVERGFFVERARAERDPTLKQIIPYTVVSRPVQADTAGEDVEDPGVESTEVLLLRRLPTGAERRLHHKLSIGIGGHIEPADASAGRAAVLAAGTRRELDEELLVPGGIDWRQVGIVNDDSNPVGAVHVGLVQVASARGHVAIRENDVLAGEFVSPARLRELHEAGADFETWSVLLVARLADLLRQSESVPSRSPATSGALA